MSYCSIHGSMAVADCVECGPIEAESEVTSAALTADVATGIACPGCDFAAKTPLALGAHVKATHKGMKLTSSKSDEGVKTYTLTPA